MPQPKKKMSNTRSGNRRSQLHIEAVALVNCGKCKTTIKPHTVCYVCGTYNGEQIIDVTKKDKKTVETTEETAE